MNLSHVSRQSCAIFAEFSYHVKRPNVFSFAVHDALKARNLPDRTNGYPADLPYALGNGVRHGEKLVALVIEHQVIVAEIRTRHVPMEVLGLEIQREYVRQKHRQIGRDFTNRFFRKSGGSRERRFL